MLQFILNYLSPDDDEASRDSTQTKLNVRIIKLSKKFLHQAVCRSPSARLIWTVQKQQFKPCYQHQEIDSNTFQLSMRQISLKIETNKIYIG